MDYKVGMLFNFHDHFIHSLDYMYEIQNEKIGYIINCYNYKMAIYPDSKTNILTSIFVE